MYEAFYIGIDGCQSRLTKSRWHRSFPVLLLDIRVESTFPEPHITSQSKHRRREEIPRCALINIGKTKVSPRPRLFNLCIQYLYLHASITEQTSSFKSSYANVWHLKQTLHEKRTYNKRLWFFSVMWTYAVSIFMTLKLWHLWRKSLQRYFLSHSSALKKCELLFKNYKKVRITSTIHLELSKISSRHLNKIRVILKFNEFYYAFIMIPSLNFTEIA